METRLATVTTEKNELQIQCQQLKRDVKNKQRQLQRILNDAKNGKEVRIKEVVRLNYN